MSRGIRATTFIADSPADDFHYIAVDVETSGSTRTDELLAVGIGIVRQSDARPETQLISSAILNEKRTVRRLLAQHSFSVYIQYRAKYTVSLTL
jgi:hypothetical protein